MVGTTIAAPLLGIEWTIGLLIAAAAMIGDLLSSFLKRRLKLPASSRAIGLDQLPEAVLPLLICTQFLALTLMDVATISAAFVVAEILLSKLLYRYHIRDRPY